MPDRPEKDDRRAIEEAMEELAAGMEPSRREVFVRLIENVQRDDVALIVLKGHLVIEERINSAIEKFAWNAKYVDELRLPFAQKIRLARAMSMEQSENSMWDLIDKLNTLRNKLAHSLKDEPRIKAIAELRTAFRGEVKNRDWADEDDDHLLLAGVIGMCLGFVDAFEKEVEGFRQFRSFMKRMDRALKSDRYKVAETKPDDLERPKDS